MSSPNVIWDSLPDRGMEGPPHEDNINHRCQTFQNFNHTTNSNAPSKRSRCSYKRYDRQTCNSKGRWRNRMDCSHVSCTKNKTLGKSTKNNLCLVTDLLHLNKYIVQKMLSLAKNEIWFIKYKRQMRGMPDPKQSNNIPIETKANESMEMLSLDLFEIKGKHFLIMVDWFSGLLWIRPLISLAKIYDYNCKP